MKYKLDYNFKKWTPIEIIFDDKNIKLTIMTKLYL